MAPSRISSTLMSNHSPVAFGPSNSPALLLLSNTAPRTSSRQASLYLTTRLFAFSHCVAFSRRYRRLCSLPEPMRNVGGEPPDEGNDDPPLVEMEKQESGLVGGVASVIEDAIPPEAFIIISACVVGLLTGIGVVIFNNAVHEIRDFFWDGIPARGASWLREAPISETWQRVILVPVLGGALVGVLNALRSGLESTSKENTLAENMKAILGPFLKATAASITLGTGNSLGPEGPSVEIGASIAKGVGSLFERSSKRKFSLVAAGSAAGIASGFNAAVAGCFFAVESVLWPSPASSSSSLPNTTSVVILSAVIASVVAEVGLGSAPAFTVPQYDFRSPSELPLYLLLGILCGLVSLMLSNCTSYALKAAASIHESTGIDKAVFPIVGGLAVGLIALAYPEILYWGFENVDILLESRPFVNGLPADLLFQLIGIKIIATSICRASGLVGGYYAPSLFIGAAMGMAFGKFATYVVSQSDPIFHLSFLEVASPQAYGLVGMAATLAGVCQVPLTSVLLLFELTQDYRIVLPLLGAVGLSSWITSTQTRKREVKDTSLETKSNTLKQGAFPSVYSNPLSSSPRLTMNRSRALELCELESSLCVESTNDEVEKLEERILVLEAMRTSYVTVSMNTLLTEAISCMLAAKQTFALIVDNDNMLLGALTLEDIQLFSKLATATSGKVQKFLVSEMCLLHSAKCRGIWTTTPDMNLLHAERVMNRHGVDQLAVVSENERGSQGHLVGILDRECISLTCRAVQAKELLNLSFQIEISES